jgi:hypothetical protein
MNKPVNTGEVKHLEQMKNGIQITAFSSCKPLSYPIFCEIQTSKNERNMFGIFA